METTQQLTGIGDVITLLYIRAHIGKANHSWQKGKKRGDEVFDTPSPCFFSYSKKESYGLLLSVMLVGYCQLLAALGATRSQYSTAVLGCHSLTEAVLVHSSSVVRLKCSFHLILSILCYNSTLLGCKSTHLFPNNQKLYYF